MKKSDHFCWGCSNEKNLPLFEYKKILSMPLHLCSGCTELRLEKLIEEIKHKEKLIKRMEGFLKENK